MSLKKGNTNSNKKIKFHHHKFTFFNIIYKQLFVLTVPFSVIVSSCSSGYAAQDTSAYTQFLIRVTSRI
jgi:hypothetical protein